MSSIYLETQPSGIKVIFTDDEAISLFGPAFAIIYKDKIGNILELPDAIKHLVDINEKVIFIHSALKQHLTDQELNAIIAHEEGHIKLGHLDIKQVNNEYNEDHEIEADSYAAKLYGRTTLRLAITKSLEISKTFNPFAMLSLENSKSLDSLYCRILRRLFIFTNDEIK